MCTASSELPDLRLRHTCPFAMGSNAAYAVHSVLRESVRAATWYAWFARIGSRLPWWTFKLCAAKQRSVYNAVKGTILMASSEMQY